MVVNFILLIMMYPVLFVLYIVLKNEGSAGSGYCFGVRMNAEWMKDSTAVEILAEYRRSLRRYLIICAVIPPAALFIPYLSITFTIYMIWLLAVILVPAIPFVRANRLLRIRKKEMGWGAENSGYTYADLKSAESGVRTVRAVQFVLPLSLSAAAGAWGLWEAVQAQTATFGILAVTFALLTLIFYGTAVWMDRQKNDVISQNSDVNLNYNRAKKKLWKNIWLTEAWLNTAFTAVAAGTIAADDIQTEVILWGSIVWSVLGIAPLFLAAKKMWDIDMCYRDLRDIALEEDDDTHWLGGILYYNKDDRHSMVTKRTGIGTTVNLASPAGIGLGIVGALGFLVIPVSCVWLILEEFTPIRLSVQEQIITAEHMKVEYEIPVSDVWKAELEEELPGWSKVSGTGMEHVEKGTFHIRNTGDCEVLLDPQNTVFLRIETKDCVYYLSDLDDAGTREVYEMLCGSGVPEAVR